MRALARKCYAFDPILNVLKMCSSPSSIYLHATRYQKIFLPSLSLHYYAASPLRANHLKPREIAQSSKSAIPQAITAKKLFSTQEGSYLSDELLDQQEKDPVEPSVRNLKKYCILFIDVL